MGFDFQRCECTSVFKHNTYVQIRDLVTVVGPAYHIFRGEGGSEQGLC